MVSQLLDEARASGYQDSGPSPTHGYSQQRSVRSTVGPLATCVGPPQACSLSVARCARDACSLKLFLGGRTQGLQKLQKLQTRCRRRNAESGAVRACSVLAGCSQEPPKKEPHEEERTESRAKRAKRAESGEPLEARAVPRLCVCWSGRRLWRQREPVVAHAFPSFGRGRRVPARGSPLPHRPNRSAELNSTCTQCLALSEFGYMRWRCCSRQSNVDRPMPRAQSPLPLASGDVDQFRGLRPSRRNCSSPPSRRRKVPKSLEPWLSQGTDGADFRVFALETTLWRLWGDAAGRGSQSEAGPFHGRSGGPGGFLKTGAPFCRRTCSASQKRLDLRDGILRSRTSALGDFNSRGSFRGKALSSLLSSCSSLFCVSSAEEQLRHFAVQNYERAVSAARGGICAAEGLWLLAWHGSHRIAPHRTDDLFQNKLPQPLCKTRTGPVPPVPHRCRLARPTGPLQADACGPAEAASHARDLLASAPAGL